MLLLLCGFGALSHAQTEEYAIDWFSLDCGGGISADEVYSVSGSIGQPDAGEVGDDVYSVTGGFWAASLLDEPPSAPVLSITPAGDHLILSWSATATGFFLEESADLFQTDGWRPVAQSVVEINGENTVTVPTSDRLVFYRLTDTPSRPRLMITRIGSNVVLSWPGWAANYFLEQNFDASQLDGWSSVELPVVVNDTQNTVTLPATNGMALFRLTQSPVALSLSIAHSENAVILSWPASASDYSLERNLDVTEANGWFLVNLPVAVANGRSTVTLPNSGDMAFFRLTRTPTRPALTITPSGNNLILSWPASAVGYYLVQNLDATQPEGWSPVNLPIVVLNGQTTVTVPASDRVVFYRLADRPSALRLTITRSGANVILSWPASATGYYLEQNPDAAQIGSWSLVETPATETNGLNVVSLPLSDGMMFFRLTQRAVGTFLRIESSGTNTVVISWPETSVLYSLQQMFQIGTGNWLSMTNEPEMVGNRREVVLPASGDGALFRLKYP